MKIETIIKSASALIDAGINVIPVRDKDEHKNGKVFPKKSPFYGWKKWQNERVTVSEFFQLQEQSGSEWIAIVLGEISRRTVCIDVDNKHWLGVEHKLFEPLKSMYPELWAKLRIHKTQSGGYHVLFSQSEGQELLRSKKLSYKEGEKEAGIELKGEGGIIVIPPSEGYTVVNNNPIPVLDANEVQILLMICEDINERKKVKREKKRQSKTDDSYYSVNPFEDFNNSDRGANILTEYGWTLDKEGQQFDHYTRSGKKGGVSASFVKDKRFYHIFSTSDSVLEGGGNYSPCAVLQAYNNWDGKELYQWLVQEGFGRANEFKEVERARKLAEKGAAPLPNFTEKGAAEYEKAIEKKNEVLPFGEFWKFGEKDSVTISRSKLINVCDGLGFRILGEGGDLYRLENDKFLKRCTVRKFQDTLVDYVYSDDEEVVNDIIDSLESFFQKSTEYTLLRLKIVEKDEILKDDKYTCYKLYQNGVLQITGESKELLSYDDIDQLIFADKIFNRNFIKSDKKGVYSDFVEKACGFDEYVKRCIGFLCHEWKDETTGFLILLVEKALDPKNGGGSGKNVFCNLLSEMTTVGSTNGAQMTFDEKAFQSWNNERVFSISDLPKNFPFTFLKEVATGSFKLKKLWKNEVDIPVEETPKVIMQTNYSFEVKDGGVARRLRAIEFTNFFTLAGGIDAHYNKHFPKGWDDTDWLDYDNTMAECIQLWLKGELKIDTKELSDDGFIKQFNLTYGQVVVDLFENNLARWIQQEDVDIDQFAKDVNDFFVHNDIQSRYRPSKQKIYQALTEFMEKRGGEFQKGVVKSRNNVQKRYNCFVVNKS